MKISFKKLIVLFMVITMSFTTLKLATAAGTEFVYDELGRLTEIIRSNGDRTIFTYDQAGNIINISVISVDAVEIRTPDDLNNIRHNLAGSFRLMADIDMTGVDWTPIGTKSAPFSGMIDGGGFVISNLAINKPGVSEVGLFGRNYGTVINIALSDANVTGGDSTGAIVGANYANVIDSRVSGASAVNGGNNVGGIAGDNRGGILRSSATANVNGLTNVGGFAGTVAGGNIEQAYATGDVTATTNAGGFVGNLTDASSIIKNAFATGQVSVTTNPAVNNAGFVGLLTSGGIENSYSLSNNANGFCGNTNANNYIRNSYFDKDIILSANVARAVSLLAVETRLAASPQARTQAEMMSRGNYINWDFENIWRMDEGTSYPTLAALSAPPTESGHAGADVNWLSFDVIKNLNTSENSIKTNLTLPGVSQNNAVITWVSSAPSVISNSGVVSRPVFGAADVEVTLTATFRHAFDAKSKEFKLVVKSEDPQDAQRPTIAPPKSVSVLTDEPARLTVSAAVPVGKLSYQWYESTNAGDVLLHNEVSSVFNAPTAAAGVRTYYVVVTNTDEAATGSKTTSAISNSATVTVISRQDAETPVITGYSNDFNVPRGSTVPLAVTAEVSRGLLSYQWHEAAAAGVVGAEITGATQPVFFAPTNEYGTRFYYAKVTNTDAKATGIQVAATSGSAISVTVSELDLFYNVDLSVNGVHDFSEATEGYNGAQEMPVTIYNTGLEGVTGLNAAISGGDTGAFTVTQPLRASLDASDPQTNFTVATRPGLPPKTYMSIISVSADNNVLSSFVVSFTVKSAGEQGPVPEPVTHAVLAAAGSGGTISPAGNNQVADGAGISFEIAPNPGYLISDVLADGLSVGAVARYTFTGVTETHSIVALFTAENVEPELAPETEPTPTPTPPTPAPVTHMVTVTAGNGGTISPVGNVSLNDGASQVFIITPYSGYLINEVLVDGLSVGAVSTYTFTDVRETHSIVAIFTAQSTGGNNNLPTYNSYNSGTNNNTARTSQPTARPSATPKPNSTANSAAEAAPEIPAPVSVGRTPVESTPDERTFEIDINGQMLAANMGEDGAYRLMVTQVPQDASPEFVVTLAESAEPVYVHIPIDALRTKDLVLKGQSANINMAQSEFYTGTGELRLPNETLQTFKRAYGSTLILSFNPSSGFTIRFQ